MWLSTTLLWCLNAWGTIATSGSHDEYGPLNFKAAFGQSPEPMIIDVNPAFIEQTRVKASLTRLAIDIDIPPFTEGVPSNNISAITDFWANNYDWAAVQSNLNRQYQHFTTTIPPLNHSQAAFSEPIPLHFVHHTSSRSDAIPLLFIHGWPGSFLEVGNILADLVEPSNPSDPAFHVVAPSIPGFAFSPAPAKPGFGLIEAGAAFQQLMLQLGYERYVIQGGDFGSHTARYMGAAYPDSVVSILCNLYGVTANETDRARQAANETTAEENAYIEFFDTTEPFALAFWNLEAAVPLQLGILLTDSPVGNLAWPYMGMRGYAPGYEWTIEDLITWAMMLYIQGPYGSVRIYRELQRVSPNPNHSVSLGDQTSILTSHRRARMLSGTLMLPFLLACCNISPMQHTAHLATGVSVLPTSHRLCARIRQSSVVTSLHM
jgi:pimeloyl-ACP methyl ester carboxylesterase